MQLRSDRAGAAYARHSQESSHRTERANELCVVRWKSGARPKRRKIDERIRVFGLPFPSAFVLPLPTLRSRFARCVTNLPNIGTKMSISHCRQTPKTKWQPDSYQMCSLCRHRQTGGGKKKGNFERKLSHCIHFAASPSLPRGSRGSDEAECDCLSSAEMNRSSELEFAHFVSSKGAIGPLIASKITRKSI